MSESGIGEETEDIKHEGLPEETTSETPPGKSGGFLRLVLFGLLAVCLLLAAVAWAAPDVFARIAEFVPESALPQPDAGA